MTFLSQPKGLLGSCCKKRYPKCICLNSVRKKALQPKKRPQTSFSQIKQREMRQAFRRGSLSPSLSFSSFYASLLCFLEMCLSGYRGIQWKNLGKMGQTALK